MFSRAHLSIDKPRRGALFSDLHVAPRAHEMSNMSSHQAKQAFTAAQLKQREFRVKHRLFTSDLCTCNIPFAPVTPR